MLFVNNENNSMEKRSREFVENVNKFMNDAMKASGFGMGNIIRNMDAKTGAIIGSMMEMYNESCDFLVAYGCTIDNMNNRLQDLKTMNDAILDQNRKLRDQNENLQEMLKNVQYELHKLTESGKEKPEERKK